MINHSNEKPLPVQVSVISLTDSAALSKSIQTWGPENCNCCHQYCCFYGAWNWEWRNFIVADVLQDYLAIFSCRYISCVLVIIPEWGGDKWLMDLSNKFDWSDWIMHFHLHFFCSFWSCGRTIAAVTGNMAKYSRALWLECTFPEIIPLSDIQELVMWKFKFYYSWLNWSVMQWCFD